MILFLKLLLAHLLGDFVLQREAWVKEKQKEKIRSPKLYLHLLMHALALAVLLGFDTRYWAGFLTVVFSHYLIDLLKLYAQKPKTRRLWFFLDQLLHLLVLYGVARSYTNFNIQWSELLSPSVLLLLTALVFVSQVCSIIIMTLISRWAPQTGDAGDDSLRRAGQFIGNLERLLIFVFIITQHWEGVGFLLAAKSIFRFGDLRQSRDRKLTEYILIGTLLSFGLAIVTALVYLEVAALM